MYWKDYKRPGSVAEALALLEHAAGRGRIIAGGTDLTLQLRQRQSSADLLVDVTGIDGLGGIGEKDGWITIGAAVTHAEAAGNPLVRQAARALAEGCGQVGAPQIRNMATLMGNVISAQPAADAAVPLTALEAEIRVVSTTGERWIPIEEAYLAVGRSAIDASREVATEIRFRKQENGVQTRFFRLAKRKALTLPVLNGAVSILADPTTKRIRRARIALGPVAAKPFRARRSEACLESVEISPELVEEAARIAAEEASPRTSLVRGSAPYRKAMVRLFLARTIGEMLAVG
ncbi:MAG: xanthine dehydrogenase family protein subunit M [Deltaproteobacteria bacterium]|nr:xanthine dehydrogenase family protein subunit M [Deltaproteobacteria bacterium]